MDTLEPIPAGALFTVSTGEYSDYSVHGVFRALKHIDTDSLRAEWLGNHPDQTDQHRFDHYGFLADMTRRGFLEPVDCWQLHLADYSSADEMSVSQYRSR